MSIHKFSVFWGQYSWQDKPTPILIHGEIDECEGRTYGGMVEIEIPDLPHTDFVAAQVSALRREQGKHQAVITEIESRINDLLCIEHKQVTA